MLICLLDQWVNFVAVNCVCEVDPSITATFRIRNLDDSQIFVEISFIAFIELRDLPEDLSDDFVRAEAVMVGIGLPEHVLRC